MRKQWRFVLIGLMAVLWAGCTWQVDWPDEASPPAFPTTAPAVTATASAVPTPVATLTPRPSLTPSPTATTVSLQPCVPQRPGTRLQEQSLSFNAALKGALRQALNSGMPLPDLNRTLQRAGIGNYPQAALSVDLNGDHYEDAVVALIDPESKATPPQGVLLFFLCQNHALTQVAAFQEPASQNAWSAPIVHFAQDLDADGRTELVVSAAHCDDAGVICQERFAILAWRDGGLRDVLRDADQPFTSPVPFLEDPDHDGILDFVVETGEGERLVWHYANGFWQRQP